MSGLQRKSLREPDETEVFPRGSSREVHLGEITVARTFHEPGWRWSTDVRPIVGTASCRFRHTGVVLSGHIRFRGDDGSEMDFGPDDVFDVPAGHDAWVIGDQAFESIDWVGAHRWASPPTGRRVLVTLLFTDIVDSTARAQDLGDAAWGRLLEEHNAVVRATLDQFGGRDVATTGDGMVAIFDGAVRALLAAEAMVLAVRGLGLAMRVAVHTGEVELVPGNVRGIAVHVAARILTLARPDEILVSDTTRGLVESHELMFVDRGRHTLKGVGEARNVFALVRRDPSAVA